LHELRPATRAYIAGLLAVAIAATAVAASRAPAMRPTDAMIAIIATACMAGAWLYPVPFAARTKLYVDTAVSVAAVLLLAPAYALAAVGVGTLLAHGIRRGSRDWSQALFNTAQAMLVALAAALLLVFAGWRPIEPLVSAPWPLLVLPLVALVTYVLNVFLVTAVTALEAAVPVFGSFRSALREDLRFEALAHISLVTTGTLAALVAIAAPWGVPLLTVPVVATHTTMIRQARLRRDQEVTRTATRLAQETAQSRSRLLTMASHDLRTPLTAIQGYIELVTGGSAGELTDDQRELLDVAHRNTLQLTGLVNDLLDLSRLDAGRLPLRARTMDVDAAIADVVRTMTPMAADKGISLVAASEHGPHLVIADPDRLNQVLINLIGNAVKFTDLGRVSIHTIDGGDWVTIVVADTGVGIAPEVLPRIFEEFSQGGEEARRRGGAGLGLTIVRQLVELLGGSISVQSELGRGTAFTLRLPPASAQFDNNVPNSKDD
jgi:signal transduction histidine kinase